MNFEDKLLFEQRFKGIGISDEELFLYLNCLRHSREMGESADLLVGRFDKKVEVNFSVGYFEDENSRSINGFVSHDGNSILFFDCESINYDKNTNVKFSEEFIFEKSFVKRTTKYKDSEFTVELPLFTQEEMQEFIDEKLSRLRGTSKK